MFDAIFTGVFVAVGMMIILAIAAGIVHGVFEELGITFWWHPFLFVCVVVAVIGGLAGLASYLTH